MAEDCTAKGRIPQVPDAQLAVVACRDNPIMLLVCKVNVSDRHEVRIWNAAYTLHAP